MVLKTREKLIEVARQLFAHKGVANTTMNDIAEASDKGRRTIYTYFKNKKEIYNAVIETESDTIVNSLRQIAADTAATPDDCLRRFLTKRLEHGRTIGSAYSSLIAWLKFDLRRMQRIHRLVAEKEDTLLRDILRRGVDDGTFDPRAAALFADSARLCLGGLDLSSIDAPDTADSHHAHAAFVDFVVAGIVKKC